MSRVAREGQNPILARSCIFMGVYLHSPACERHTRPLFFFLSFSVSRAYSSSRVIIWVKVKVRDSRVTVESKSNRVIWKYVCMCMGRLSGT